MKMFLVVTTSVIIGMLIRKFATNFVMSKSQLIERFSVLLFVIVFAAIWIEEWENILSYIQQAGLITLVLNVTMMIIGYYVAKLLASGITAAEINFFRMWSSKWNFGSICFKPTI